MEECYMCGVPMGRVRLFDAVSNEGVVKICEDCSNSERVPIIRRPTTIQLKEAERKQTFYERFSGVKKEEEDIRKSPEEEVTLREIVERNFKKSVPEGLGPRPELIKNFQWVVMRARRMKKLTQEQLAREIQESEAAIKMAEQGRLPEDDYKLVNKLEIFLGIKIVRKEFSEEISTKEKPDWLSFDMQESKELTLEDVRNMKKMEEDLAEREKEEQERESETFKEDVKEDSENEELSKEEMDKIVFGQ